MHECTNARMHQPTVAPARIRGAGVRVFGVRIGALLHWCILALLLSGCAKAQAKVTPDMPLDMPAPPPRVIETADVEPPQPVPMPDPARRPPVRRPEPAPAGRLGRPDPRGEAPKSEAPAAAAADAPKPADESPRPPATTLQTTPTGAEGDVERSILGMLNRASGDLNRVDYRALDADARTQYDTAKRFKQQAEEAVRAKNLVFAKNMAEKAATLAAQLAGR